MTKDLEQTARRTFMSRFGIGAAIAAGIGATLATAKPALAQTGAFKPRRHSEDGWMDMPNVSHRVVIDSAFPAGGGAALLYANNNILANKSGYGLDAQEIAIIVVLRHLSTPFAFTDVVWARHGEALSDIIDFKSPATKAAPLTNLYNAGGGGMSLPNRGVTLASLAEKNVHFAVCGSAMRVLASAVAQRAKLEADAVYNEFAGNLVPNSHVVPAGVVAVNRAQEYGYTLLTAV